MNLIPRMKQFVAPYYEKKDAVHDLSHVERVLRVAEDIAKERKVDDEVLTVGAYLHGIIHTDPERIKEFLRSEEIQEERIKRFLEVTHESQKDAVPESMEGKILHDAHLLEGGRTFMIVKSLISGTAKGQSLRETVTYIEEHLLGRFSCVLPECQKEYRETERYTREFLEELKQHL